MTLVIPPVTLVDKSAMARFPHVRPQLQQLLNTLYVEAVRQRRSVVLLSDVGMAHALWGRREQWPQRWRTTLKTLLRAMSGRFIESAIWLRQPRRCARECLWHERDERHQHAELHLAEGFLGDLEYYSCKEHLVRGRRIREFDFGGLPDDREAKAHLKAAWKVQQIAYLHGPALVYGNARWSGLSQIELKVWQAVFAELTTAGSSRRPDRAQVLSGRVCPLLPEQPHVAFTGNFRGKRRNGGAGYRLIGSANRGWLHKAGFGTVAKRRPRDPANLRQTRVFLDGLRKLEQKFGIVMAGHLQRDWMDGPEMLALASSSSSRAWRRLEELRLCVFAPETYLEKVDTYFRLRGAVARQVGQRPLAARVEASGLRKQEIARHAGISPSALSDFISGRRGWPERVSTAVHSLLDELENSADLHISPS